MDVRSKMYSGFVSENEFRKMTAKAQSIDAYLHHDAAERKLVVKASKHKEMAQWYRKGRRHEEN